MATDQLSATFAALADPTRRAILARLAHGETSVTELARPFEMSLPAVTKHLKVLQRAGLVAQSRRAQWRPCRPGGQADGRTRRSGLGNIAASGKSDSTGSKIIWKSCKPRKRNMAARKSDPETAAPLPGAMASEPEFVITRVLAAPRELVFRAWTEPEMMARWWGPHEFTNPVCRLDVRPGGAWYIVMRGSDGVEHPCKGVFREVVPPERIVMTIDHSDLPEDWHDMLDPGRPHGQARPALLGVATVDVRRAGGSDDAHDPRSLRVVRTPRLLPANGHERRLVAKPGAAGQPGARRGCLIAGRARRPATDQFGHERTRKKCPPEQH